MNSVAFADDSSQILFSGSDDGTIKIWDRRNLSESRPKPCMLCQRGSDYVLSTSNAFFRWSILGASLRDNLCKPLILLSGVSI